MPLKDILKKVQIAERILAIYEYSWLWRIVKSIKNAVWYPVVYRTTRRYHILDLRDGGNGYELGWYDSDSQILQANFLILKNYVEHEKPFDLIDWDWCDDSRVVAQEIKDLYAWWTVGRAKKHKNLNREWQKVERNEYIPVEGGGFQIKVDPRAKELMEIEAKLEEEDTEMLIRLIKIRRSLWT